VEHIEKLAAPKKSCLIIALAIFLITAMMAVMVNSFVVGYGLSTGRSISRYVGYEVWSAVVFAIGNFFVSGVMGVFLWRLGKLWEMPRIYYYCVFLMVLGLITLSVCPIGLYDVGEQKSVVSLVHELSSRTMFIMMMIAAGLMAIKPYGTKVSRVLCVIYVFYGLVCVFGYLGNEVWFESRVLIFEILYIVGFVVMLLCQRDKRLIKQE